MSSALNVFLHPLVIINISDHFTRARMQKSQQDANPRVLGALYGTQEGRRVEIRTSFELIYQRELQSGRYEVDREYIEEKRKQYEQVFPNYEILGWYSTGEDLREGDEHIHEQMLHFNDNLLYLICSTNFNLEMKDLPLRLFESTVQMQADGANQIILSAINFDIETDESERISIDHVNRFDSGSTNQSALVSHLSSLYNAVTMLNDRVKAIVSYLEAVKEGKVEGDYEILRHVNNLSNRLPAIDSTKFTNDFTNEMNETLMITYLSSMTKGTHLLNELIEKHSTAFEKRSRRSNLF